MMEINGCLQNTFGSEELNRLHNRSAALGLVINLRIDRASVFLEFCAPLHEWDSVQMRWKQCGEFLYVILQHTAVQVPRRPAASVTGIPIARCPIYTSVCACVFLHLQKRHFPMNTHENSSGGAQIISPRAIYLLSVQLSWKLPANTQHT